MQHTELHKPTPAPQYLRMWAQWTLDSILRNMKVQGIFDEGEVYPGYFEKNNRAGSRSWRSTGAGSDSFSFQVMNAAVSQAQVDFFYLYYLNFVDMGVGKGRPIGKVNRTLSADKEIRYMEWNSKEGSTQRPFAAIEFRYRQNQLARHFAEAYKTETQIVVIKTLEGDIKNFVE